MHNFQKSLTREVGLRFSHQSEIRCGIEAITTISYGDRYGLWKERNVHTTG